MDNRNDIDQAKLEVFIEQTKLGVLKVVESRFDAIKARILADCNLAPEPRLPWRFDIPRHLWDDLWRGDTRSVVVPMSEAWGNLELEPGDTMHLFPVGAPQPHDPLRLTVTLARKVWVHTGKPVVLVTFEPRHDER